MLQNAEEVDTYMEKQALLNKAIKIIREESIISFLRRAILYLRDKLLEPCIIPYAIHKMWRKI